MTEEARARTAASLRRLGHALMGHEAAPELLERVTTAADRLAEELEQQPPRQRDLLELKRRMYDVPVQDGAPVSHFDECFVSGAQNPMGIAMTVRRDGDDMVADVHLGAAFEGAPGRSHGGIVAAIFDDLQGYLLTLLQQPGFTGGIDVTYLAATPIDEALEFRARVVAREGRKIRTEAEAYSAGEVVARSTAVFVAVDTSRIRG